MTPKEIEALCTNTTGLRHALVTEFGRSIPLNKLTVEASQPIDIKLLATTLSQYHEGEGYEHHNENDIWRFKCESLYIVWDDDQIEKSTQVDYLSIWNTLDSWSGEEVHSVETSEMEDEETRPIASHFTEKANVEHLILLDSSARKFGHQQKKIESITIKIYTPHNGMDITAIAKEIMEVWEEGHGLQDYLFRFSQSS